jgi:hypothetical protein
MKWPTVEQLARAKQVSLEHLVEPLSRAASQHFGPRLRVEVVADGDRLNLYAAYLVKAIARGPTELPLDRVIAAGLDFAEDEELMIQLFCTEEELPQARLQDEQYGRLTGFRSEGCGFAPVARRAIAAAVGYEEEPMEPAVQRLFSLAASDPEERRLGAVLRRASGGRLVLKRLARPDAATLARHGRAELPDDAALEVTLREVDPRQVITALWAEDLQKIAAESAGLTARQLEDALAAQQIHLRRGTLFRTRVERINEPAARRAIEAFGACVAPDTEARHLPPQRDLWPVQMRRRWRWRGGRGGQAAGKARDARPALVALRW